MKNIRSLFIALAGVAVFAGLALLTVSLTLVFAAILTVLLAVRLLSSRTKPVPVRSTGDRRRTMRVWNDGRGTIIDL
jgi:membrane protein implicated in regulation of membrane protease activity